MHARIDAHGLAFLVAVWINLQVADFDDAVCIDVRSGGFQVEENQRVLQIEFHNQ